MVAGYHLGARPQLARYDRVMKSSQLETLWQGRIGVVIVVSILGALSITACGAWPWLVTWLESTTAPAWVQAVGSVVAIAAGALAIRWQVTQEARREVIREIRGSLQEVAQVRALVAAALAHAFADQVSCSSSELAKSRVKDQDAQAERAAIHVAFQQTHLDHIRAMNVRLAFIRARAADGSAKHMFSLLEQRQGSGAPYDVYHHFKSFDAPLERLREALSQLDREIAGLDERLRVERGD
jgi:hypothetical protein